MKPVEPPMTNTFFLNYYYRDSRSPGPHASGSPTAIHCVQQLLTDITDEKQKHPKSQRLIASKHIGNVIVKLLRCS